MTEATVKRMGMKIVLADDAALIREGLASLLVRLGHEVVVQLGSAPEVEEYFAPEGADLPDVLVTDVRMPPGMTDDGLRSALEVRRRFPGQSIMVLSQYVAPAYARTLFTDARQSPTAAGTGYLLKERVAQVKEFGAALDSVAAGGIVVDPEVARALTSGNAVTGVASLTPREREVLELMAQGLSNTDIADRLFLSRAAVAKHVASIFRGLGLQPGEDNRRVRAILEYLDSTRPLNGPF